MFFRYALFITSLGIFSCLNAAEHSNVPTITLVSAQGQEFIVPREIALQSETINSLFQGASEEGASGKVDFRDIPEPLLEEAAQLLWSLYFHRNLKGKELLDALQHEVPLRNFMAVLEVANFLDLKSIFALAARMTIRALMIRMTSANPYARNLVETLAQQFENAAPEFARYYFLLMGDRLDKDKVPLSSYGFSIQDYLDYRHTGTHGLGIYPDQNRLDLQGLQLNSLEGIHNIPGIKTIEFLILNNNPLQIIGAHAFKGLDNLHNIYLASCEIHYIDPQAFIGLEHLIELVLSSNQLTKINFNLFAGLKSLTTLYLDGNGAEEILFNARIDLPHLSFLGLSNNKLTIIPLPFLKGFTHLEDLGLSNNPLTQENIQAIRKAFPNIEVHYLPPGYSPPPD